MTFDFATAGALLGYVQQYTGVSVPKSYTLGELNPCGMFAGTNSIASVFGDMSYKVHHELSSSYAAPLDCWLRCGLHGSHVFFITEGTSLTEERLIESPREYAISCRLRGLNVPSIEYDGPLYKGPALDAFEAEMARIKCLTNAIRVSSIL